MQLVSFYVSRSHQVLDPILRKHKYCAPQSTPTQRARQLAFLDKAMAKASKKAGWFIGAHLAFPGPAHHRRSQHPAVVGFQMKVNLMNPRRPSIESPCKRNACLACSCLSGRWAALGVTHLCDPRSARPSPGLQRRSELLRPGLRRRPGVLGLEAGTVLPSQSGDAAPHSRSTAS